MTDIITTLHLENDADTNLYPNIKKENIPDESIDRSKLDSEIKELLNNIGELHPSGADTSTNILEKTSDEGIWIGTDTGDWYYWNGTEYVSGGIYQATQISDENQNKIDSAYDSIVIDLVNLNIMNNLTDVVKDKYLSITNGSIQNASGYAYGYYTNVHEGDIIQGFSKGTQGWICCYDSNNDFISSIDNLQIASTKILPNGTAKIGITYKYNENPVISILGNGSITEMLGSYSFENKKISNYIMPNLAIRNRIDDIVYNNDGVFALNGTIGVNTNYKYQNPIYIKGIEKIYINTGTVFINFYDSDKHYLSNISGSVVNVPTNAYYAGISCPKTSKVVCDLSLNDDDMFLINNSLKSFSNIYPNNRDFKTFEGFINGNIVFFGDSRVDGSSTTNHTSNTIGVDRPATNAPNCFTSILENLIKKRINNPSFRCYNGGYAGKTLQYIVNNYSTIMSAFSNVKTAFIMLDINIVGSANSYSTWASSLRNETESLINKLMTDGINVVLLSDQPTKYLGGNISFAGINSFSERMILDNVAKDLANKYNLPYYDLQNDVCKLMVKGFYPSEFFGDGIHFGDFGHKIEGYLLYNEFFGKILINPNGENISITDNATFTSSDAVNNSSSPNVNNKYLGVINKDIDGVLLQNNLIINGFETIITYLETPNDYSVTVDGVSVNLPYTLSKGCHEIEINADGNSTTWQGLNYTKNE